MKLNLLAAAVDARHEGEADVVHLTHDSRDVQPGSLFVAVPGRTVDGRRFVEAALKAGAVAVALPDDPASAAAAAATRAADRALVWLTDARAALPRLAATLHGHPSQALRLVGLTGTNGKSTVATMMAAIVRASGRPEGVVGTLGNRIAGRTLKTRFTTPEAPTLQRVLAEMVADRVDVAVMEVTSVGLAEHRVDETVFAAAGFLNLSVDHLDYHGDMATYGAAKKPLFFDRLAADGIAVIDVLDPYGAALADELEAARPGVTVWRLSLTDTTDVRFGDLVVDAAGVRGTLETPAGAVKIDSPLVGRFNARNVAMAAALSRAVDLPAAAITAGLAKTEVPGRLQRVPNDRGLWVIVDYAHTPDALVRVIEAVRPLTTGKLWCVFGCAGDRDATKRVPMGAAAAAADGVVVTSDNPRTEDPVAIAEAVAVGAIDAGRTRASRPTTGSTWIEPDRAAAIAATLAAAEPGDTVLIAGKGHENYQEVDGVRRPFDDVRVARAALEAGR